jgi:hypothetical protein
MRRNESEKKRERKRERDHAEHRAYLIVRVQGLVVLLEAHVGQSLPNVRLH